MKPRKKWEPVYRFGGNPTDWGKPNPLGENQIAFIAPKPKSRYSKKRKK